MAERMFDLTAKSDGEAAATAHPGKFVPRYQAVPGTPVAAVGFACTLLAMEGFCLSLVFWVGVDTSPATLAGAALSIGLLLLVADSTMPGGVSQPANGEASGCAGPSDAAQASPSLQEEEARKRQVNRWRGACTKVSQGYGLTAREAEILLLLARGRTAVTIAETLVIAPSTAKAHLRNIYAKLGVHTQQELIDLVESYID